MVGMSLLISFLCQVKQQLGQRTNYDVWVSAEIMPRQCCFSSSKQTEKIEVCMPKGVIFTVPWFPVCLGMVLCSKKYMSFSFELRKGFYGFLKVQLHWERKKFSELMLPNHGEKKGDGQERGRIWRLEGRVLIATYSMDYDSQNA